MAELVHKVKLETAKSYLNALRSYHLEHHLDINIFQDPRLELIIHGAK